MRIGIITFNHVINYGASLQAYGLYKFISQNYPVECEIVDYKNTHFEKQYKPISLQMLSHPKSLFRKVSLSKYMRKRRKEFDDFEHRFLSLSRVEYSRKNIHMAKDSYDIFIVGSDQVWNLACTGDDLTYFLDFVTDANKKNSYAASFGADILDSTCSEIVGKYIADFKNISVREQTGVDIVAAVSKRKAKVVLDPSFLIDVNDWRDIEKEYRLGDKYILVVNMGGNSKTLIDNARKFAKERHQKVVYINLSEPDIVGITNVRDAAPQQWLWLVDHAECVMTNSFHGCVFSIIFHKTFYYELTKGKKTNTRISCLMDNLGIVGNEIREGMDIIPSCPIDYKKVDVNLSRLREESINYLEGTVMG